MALTTEEEDQVRALLALQRLTLAELPASDALTGTDLFLLRQGVTDTKSALSGIATFILDQVPVPPDPPVDATTTVAGLIRIATDAEVEAGTVNDAAVTPASLLSIFTDAGGGFSGNDSYALPGGLIIKWGTVTAVPASGSKVYTFAEPFPTACLFATSSQIGGSNGGGEKDWWGTGAWTTTGVTIYSGRDAACDGSVLAIGY